MDVSGGGLDGAGPLAGAWGRYISMSLASMRVIGKWYEEMDLGNVIGGKDTE